MIYTNVHGMFSLAPHQEADMKCTECDWWDRTYPNRVAGMVAYHVDRFHDGADFELVSDQEFITEVDNEEDE
jgi:hypothetical protein